MAFRWYCVGCIVVLGCGGDTAGGGDASSTGTTSPTDTSSSGSSSNAGTGTSTSSITGGASSSSTGSASSTGSSTTTGDPTDASTSSVGQPESSSGSDSGSDSGGQHACPGSGYCESKPEANVIIHDNHALEHAISILNEHIYACEEHEYDIQGAADHSHIVTLTPSHYGTIDDSGMQITVTSTEASGHTHDVWSDCE